MSMDSPVIVDTASKFGQNLNLGFPFDDEGFGRRGDIRSHLDDLAARHPEFADHLLGPAWGDIPFHGSLRNRRRGSGSGSSHQGHPDEDARSQASGSSAASAASGASGVSSHGEPDQAYHHQETPNKLPQYGLRNTVDIGQHRHNMQNQEKANRGQRSMSAPPENRQGQEEVQVPIQGQQSQNYHPQNPRFVSRVDITPQLNPQTGEKITPKQQQQQAPPQQQQPHQQKQQHGNVRHIPIFVEGRDEPVIPRKVEEPIFRQQQSPPRFREPQYREPQFREPHFREPQFESPPEFHSPPQFHRPSHFNQHFGGRHSQWPGFQESFNTDTFDHPGVRKTHQPSHPSPFRQQQNHFPQAQNSNQQQQPQQHHQAHPKQQQQQPHQQFQHQSQEEPTPVPIKQKPVVPKEPLERVALVQQEVDSLTEQVKLWNGDSRKDKQYIYLDEMLTRELIKLDDIETEGKENVRQARKNAIKSIQDSISLLESKVLGAEQNKSMNEEPMEPHPVEGDKVEESSKPMETETKPDDPANVKAIPLPPGPSTSPTPSSPNKESAEIAQIEQEINSQLLDDKKNDSIENNQIVDPNVAIPMEDTPNAEIPLTATAMEVQSIPEVDQNRATLQVTGEKNVEEVKEQKKSPKKVKKSKKQTPVSTEPIPLPAPEAHET